MLGLIVPEIAKKFPPSKYWDRDDAAKCLTFTPGPGPSEHESIDSSDHRSRIMAEYLKDVREAGVFRVLDGWRDELYPVYGSPQRGQPKRAEGPGRELLFSMERSASALFGIVTYGVHMTAYVEARGEILIWAPKRSPTKQTYPNMMDNTVAGGLSTGELPFECLLRECAEEASLPKEVSSNATACGTVTYVHIRGSEAGGENRLCQPECQYVYDLKLSPDVIPKPGDNEAVDFQLLTLNQVKTAIRDGRFKPNCALVLLDFFVRHGIITFENEPHYLEIVSRMHRPLPYPCKYWDGVDLHF